MKKYLIESVDNFVYLLNNDNNMYRVMVEFYDIEKPKKGDILYINNKLFNYMTNNFVSFGLLEEDINSNSINDEELIVIEKDNKKIYLKRLYG